MAGREDPFTPGPTVDPTAGIPNMDTFENLRNQWSTWLDQPGNRNALLQFGVTLMQPPHFGENVAAQVGRGIGAAGEAATREQEAASKQELRAAQAQAAEARAGTAGLAVGLQRERLQAAQENIALQNRVKLGIEYGRFTTAAEAENRKRMADWEKAKILDPTLPQPTLVPIPTQDEFIAQRSQFLPGTGLAAQPPTTAAPTRQVAPPGKKPVDVKTPEDAAKLAPGTYYRTPNGDEFIR